MLALVSCHVVRWGGQRALQREQRAPAILFAASKLASARRLSFSAARRRRAEEPRKWAWILVAIRCIVYACVVRPGHSHIAAFDKPITLHKVFRLFWEWGAHVLFGFGRGGGRENIARTATITSSNSQEDPEHANHHHQHQQHAPPPCPPCRSALPSSCRPRRRGEGFDWPMD